MNSFERSFLTILVCLFFISSCSTTHQAYRQNIQMYLDSDIAVALSNDEVIQSPIDLIYVKNGERPVITMALAFIEDGDYKWISADGVMFITRNGRLFRTVGLHKNLIYLSNLSSDPLASIKTNDKNMRWHRMIDTEHGDYGAKLFSHFTMATNDSISVQTEQINTKKYVEIVDYRSVKYGTHRWTNTFWFHSETGQLLKSSQKVSPQSETIEITYLSRTMRLLEK